MYSHPNHHIFFLSYTSFTRPFGHKYMRSYTRVYSLQRVNVGIMIAGRVYHCKSDTQIAVYLVVSHALWGGYLFYGTYEVAFVCWFQMWSRFVARHAVVKSQMWYFAFSSDWRSWEPVHLRKDTFKRVYKWYLSKESRRLHHCTMCRGVCRFFMCVEVISIITQQTTPFNNNIALQRCFLCYQDIGESTRSHNNTQLSKQGRIASRVKFADSQDPWLLDTDCTNRSASFSPCILHPPGYMCFAKSFFILSILSAQSRVFSPRDSNQRWHFTYFTLHSSFCA